MGGLIFDDRLPSELEYPFRHRPFRVLYRIPQVQRVARAVLRCRVTRAVLRILATKNLRRLNDVLAGTSFGDRYRVMGGMMLGWAREGQLIAHDLRDFDFAYDDVDHERFLDAMPVMVRAGFRPLYRYANGDGAITEHSFRRHSARYDFFRLTRYDGRHRYHVYGFDPDNPSRGLDVVCEIAAQPWEPFEFLGKTWRKPVDHEAELALTYGSWRVPDPNWSCVDDGAAVDRREWKAKSAEGR